MAGNIATDAGPASVDAGALPWMYELGRAAS
jgi:hypothetical protein